MAELKLFTTHLEAAGIFAPYYIGLILALAFLRLTLKFWAPLLDKLIPGFSSLLFEEEKEHERPHTQSARRSA